MKAHLSRSLTLLLLVFFLSAPCIFSQSPPLEVKNAALSGLDEFIEPGMFDGNLVKLGNGFMIHTVNPLSLVENRDRTLSALVTPMDVWRFPVFKNDTPAGLLTVEKINGRWEAVSFGGADLSREIVSISEAWRETDGFQFRFIRLYQARSDFMEISSGTQVLGYAPLKSAKMALGLENATLTPNKLLFDSEILLPLKDLVTETLTNQPLEENDRNANKEN